MSGALVAVAARLRSLTMSTSSSLRRRTGWRGALLVAGSVTVALLMPARAEAAASALDAWSLRLAAAPGTKDYSGTSGAFTVSAGTNRLLVGGFCFETAAAVTMTTAQMRLDGAAGTLFAPFAHTGAISRRSHCYMGYLIESQVTAGSHTVYVNVVNSSSTITDIDVMSAQFQGVDQASPTAAGSYAANNSAAVSVTFGATVNYFANGMSTYITENGNTVATITHVAGFTTSGSSTGNGQSVYGAVATNSSAGTYAATETVTYSGTTSTRSAIVVAALNPSVVVVPTLTSPTASAITNTTATLGANVTSNGGGTLTARGTCWGTTAAPTANCVAEGGTATGVFTQARTGLTAGTLLYYRGYATNSAGTAYSPDGSFYTEPTTQASAVTFSGVTTTAMTVNWTRGSGSGVIVLMKQASAVDSNPVDGTYTGYTANAAFGSGTQIGTGNYVVYKGTGTSVPVTGLTAGTTYHVAVYEYAGTLDTSGVNQGTNYKLTPATGNQTTSTDPRVAPGVPSASVTGCTSATITAPYSGDANANSTTTFRSGPSASGPWTSISGCSAVSGATPRTCNASALANATTYYFQVEFADADGVFGANPQAIGAYATQDCPVTPGAPGAVADACKRITVTAPFGGDFDADSTTAVDRGAADTGPWAAVCASVAGASPRSCVDNGVSASSSYYYRVTFTDADGVNGTNPQVTGPIATPACTVDPTTAGTASAVVGGCAQITVTAPFTGDDDGDGAVLVEYNTSNIWPGTTACPAVGGASPRTCLISGLAASTAYYVRATYSDPDGVSGTPVQVLPGTYTTTACSGSGAPPMILFLAPTRDAILGGSDRFKVQVYDADGVSSTNILWGLDGAAPAAAVTQATNVNCNLGSQTACKVVHFDVDTTALANGSHYVTVRATDSAGTPSVAQLAIGFRVNNTGSAAAGSGNLLRRTHSSQLCSDCHNLATHSSQATDTSYGSWAQECLTCHTPHETTNISLVRPSIQTPSSGARSVDFRNTAGKADYSYATVTSPGSGVCEVCHTLTRNSDATPRFRNTGGSDGGKHYTSRCTGCHTHSLGFAAGESEGSATCAGCHPDIWNGMNGTVAKTSKHTIGNLLGTNDAFTDSGLTWGSPLSANAAANRSCVNMCHNDHPHTLTSPVTATHENNVYRDATTSASRAAATRTSADKDKADFQAADTNGGTCVSCHRNPVTATRPAIGKVAYDASAHDFTTNAYGTWTYTLHDGGVISRNCTKCHADGDAAPGASAIPFGAVHFSDYPKLLTGAVNPSGTAASLQCYACHGDGTTGTNRSGKVIATQIAKTRNHPANADAVHDSVTESNNAAFGNTLGVTGRHSNCLDCHDGHQAKAGTHATPGNLAGPPLEGAWGAQLSSNPTFWTDTAAGNFTKKTVVSGTDLEATLCFKCHTKYDWGTTATSGRGVPPAAPSGGTYITGTAAFANGSATVTGTGTGWSATSHLGWVIKNNANGTWYLVTAVASATSLTIAPAANFAAAASAYTLQMAETDVAKEFNPGNVGNFAGTWAATETAGGFHPVLAAAGSNLGAVNLANLVTTNQPWSTTVRNTMTCTDCHESDTTTDPNGPHGSTAGFLLRGPNTGWSAATTTGTTSMPAGTFCANCHSSTWANSRFVGTTGNNHFGRSDHRVACFNCHAAIPHGGPRPGMLIAPAGAAAGVGGTIAGWDTTPPYWALGTSTNKLYIASYPANNTTNWGQSNCGCNGTGH